MLKVCIAFSRVNVQEQNVEPEKGQKKRKKFLSRDRIFIQESLWKIIVSIIFLFLISICDYQIAN